jgi:transposase
MPNKAIQLETLGTAALINYIKELETNLQEYQYKYLEMKEKYGLLVYKRFARSAEQLLADDKQPLLFVEEAGELETKEEEPQELETVKSFTRRKSGGRKPISASIERRPRIINISESEKTCACGAKLVKIGEETSEKLKIKPMRIYVDLQIRPKYACPQCEGTEDEGRPVVRIAPVEPAMIPKSIASPSLLSTVFTLLLPFQAKGTCPSPTASAPARTRSFPTTAPSAAPGPGCKTNIRFR